MIFLVLLFWMVFGIGLVVGTAHGINAIHSRKVYGLEAKKKKELSEPSKQILKQYRRLPVENRPYANLPHILEAMDIKYGKDSVNEHFRKFNGTGYVFKWDCSCWRGSACLYKDYRDIYSGITEIQQALVNQEHAASVAAVEGGLSAVKSFTEELRKERDLINDTTKQLSQRI